MRSAVVLMAAWAAVTAAASTGGFAPRLRAEEGRFDPATGPTLVLDVSQRLDERPMGRIAFVAPPEARFTVPAAGTRVGDMAVELVRGRGSTALAGNLVVAGKPGNCVSAATEALSAKLGRSLTLRLDVSRAGGSTRLTVCLPQPSAGTVPRLVVRLERGLSAPARGPTVWRAFFTPVVGGRAATTVSRGIVINQSFLTLEAPAARSAVRRGSRLRLRGSLSMPGPQARRWIRILAGRHASSLQLAGRTRTNAAGTFTVRMRVPDRPGPLLVQARARSRNVRCLGREPDAPAGCRHSTIGGASSNVLSFVVR